jgi:DNA-binding Lrp family transcriptional regulator
VLVKFVGKKPGDDEILKAIGTSYTAQFAAKTGGDYDLVIYLVERSYEDAVRFTNTFNMSLSKYNMLAYTTRVWGNFGFFPLNKKLIEQFDIFDTYKNLLFGLSDGGRDTFTDIGKNFNQGPAQMLYAYDRLARTEILRRVTYYEQRSKEASSMVVIAKIENAKLFEESKSKWFVKLAKEYEKRENECVFMCDIPSPKGIVVVANFANKKMANKFLACMKSGLRGAALNKMQISKVLLGSLGVRDFDMRYSSQYRSLERRKLVPAIGQKVAESVVENPNAV